MFLWVELVFKSIKSCKQNVVQVLVKKTISCVFKRIIMKAGNGPVNVLLLTTNTPLL